MTNDTGRLKDKDVALARLSELKQLVAEGIDSGPGEIADRTALKVEARTREPTMSTADALDTPRTRIKLRISERLLADAQSLGIDVDAAVEAGLESAIFAARIEKFQSLAADLTTTAACRGLTDERLDEVLSDIA